MCGDREPIQFQMEDKHCLFVAVYRIKTVDLMVQWVRKPIIPPPARNIRKMSKRLGKALSLHDFIRKQQVISLYRQLLQCVKRLDDVSVRNSLKLEIRTEFHNGMTLKDNNAIKTAIINGQRSLTQLEDMTGGVKSVTMSKYKGDSWLDTKDEVDVRGRVGTGWPWS